MTTAFAVARGLADYLKGAKTQKKNATEISGASPGDAPGIARLGKLLNLVGRVGVEPTAR